MKNENHPNPYETVLHLLRNQEKDAPTKEAFMCLVCQVLQQELRHYDWVGYYLVDSESERELVLGPYVGEPTEHVRIAFGQGICGQAAERRETYLSADVSQETNYLSCSLRVRSEIVVPIVKAGKILGEIDVDSHTVNAFGEADRQLLETLARTTADRFP